MGSSINAWVVGIGVAVVGGYIVTALFHWALGRYLRLPSKASLSDHRRVPASLTGTIERVFFAVLTGFEISGTPAAMIAWLGVKLATNWNHPEWTKGGLFRAFAFRALLTGLVSMLCAAVGGLIVAGKIRVGI